MRLDLDSSQARILLGWRLRWSLSQALEPTFDRHHAWRAGADMQVVTRE